MDKHPKYADLSLEKFKEVISSFNGSIWKTVLEHRDGVELPEQLGYLFIGSCPRKKGETTDYKKSKELGQKVQIQNWETDNHIGKIFYTNFETKYRFRFHELWGFTAVRDFKRSTAQTYPENWNMYVKIDNMQRVSKIFRKQRYKILKQEEKVVTLDSYDEFAFD